ncbi:hypothetical protein OS176_12905 [Xanthomonadaceae bacterium XH05]|nr:hypothetical protein [Xanthomonadaceae bacterium XH05]
MSIKRLIPALALAILLPMSAGASEYVAHAVANGRAIPLPAPSDMSAVDTLYLVDVEWSEYTGPKTRVAVSKVDNRSSMRSYSMSDSSGYSSDISFAYQSVPVNGIEAMITDVMHRTGRFRMVERQAIGNVLQEQDFGASGRVAQPSAAKIGSVLGAEYLIEVVITSYEPGVAGNNVNVGALASGTRLGGLLGNVHVGSKTSIIGMNFRLIDATTSEVIFTNQVDRQIKDSGIGFGAARFGNSNAMGGFMSQYSKTPIGQAVTAAVNEGVYDLIAQIGARPASGSVVKADGNGIYLNLGAGSVQVGDRLSLMSKGEALIDPETGISLGSEESEIGSVEVTSVQDKFSIARLSGGKMPKAGDIVRSHRAPAQLAYAPLDPALTKKPSKRNNRR